MTASAVKALLRVAMVVAAAAITVSIPRSWRVLSQLRCGVTTKAQKRTPAGNKLPSCVHKTLLSKDLKPGRLVIIGDVHGCLSELQELLTKVEYLPQTDNLIFVGDLVNKGPHSIEVLDLFLKLGALSVRGNHDDAALQRWSDWSSHGQALKERHAWVPDMQAHHVEVLEELPFTISLPDYGITVVHAGLLPQQALDHQNLWSMYKMRNMAPAAAAGVDKMEWVALEKAKDGGQAWAGQWPGPSHVFFGHDAKRQLQLCPYASGLDSGCVVGFQLTAAVIPPLQRLLGEAAGAGAGSISGLLGSKLQQGEAVTREDLGVQLVAVKAARPYDPPAGGIALPLPAGGVPVPLPSEAA